MELDVVIDVVAMEAVHHARKISIPASAPALGVGQIVWKVPSSVKYRVHSIYFEFVTSVNLNGRIPGITWLDQNGNKLGQVAVSTTNSNASFNTAYTFAAHLPGTGFASQVIVTTPIPVLELQEGWTVRIDIAGIDVTGDQINNAILVVDSIPSRRVPAIDMPSFEDV